jgi:undecaprenyl-diphosphatase
VHWLQAFDLDLLRFINQTLSNSFFDVVMPFASGNKFFFPVVIFAGVLLLVKGGARGRLCVLMLLLILWPGDSYICNTIKHAIERPRPFITHPEVLRPGSTRRPNLTDPDMAAVSPVESGAEVRPTGRSGYNSMPSSHAANWFAATMILLVYYRRSIRFMLPLACVVAFSRIYNGVHYPSDVLAGSILGAGYAVAGMWAFNALWQWIGKKCFPLAWEKLPSLLNPEFKMQMSSPTENKKAGAKPH